MRTHQRSLLRALAAVPHLGQRRRLARARLGELDPAVALSAWSDLVRDAVNGPCALRDAALWVGAAVADERHAGTAFGNALVRCGVEGTDPLARALCADAPPERGAPRARSDRVPVRMPATLRAYLKRNDQQCRREGAAEQRRWDELQTHRVTPTHQLIGEPTPPASCSGVGPATPLVTSAGEREIIVQRLGHVPVLHARVLTTADQLQVLLNEPVIPWHLVVVVASARPLLPGLAWLLFAHDQALARPEVQRALAGNPSAPTALRQALLPVVDLATRRRVAGRHAHAVTTLAGALLAERATPPFSAAC